MRMAPVLSSAGSTRRTEALYYGNGSSPIECRKHSPDYRFKGRMKELRESLIPLAPDWKPNKLAVEIEREVEKWWDEGWVFLRAETDLLMESVCLFFERPVLFEENAEG